MISYYADRILEMVAAECEARFYYIEWEVPKVSLAANKDEARSEIIDVAARSEDVRLEGTAQARKKDDGHLGCATILVLDFVVGKRSQELEAV